MSATLARLSDHTEYYGEGISTRLLVFAAPDCSCNVSLHLVGLCVVQSVFQSSRRIRERITIWRGDRIDRRVITTESGVAVLGPIPRGAMRMVIDPAQPTRPGQSHETVQTEWIVVP